VCNSIYIYVNLKLPTCRYIVSVTTYRIKIQSMHVDSNTTPRRFEPSFIITARTHGLSDYICLDLTNKSQQLVTSKALSAKVTIQ
jgi:hypothetical protein